MNIFLKRIFDIVFPLVSLLIAFPLMAVIALLLWIESPGNIIFSQTRIGLHGRRFRMFKFRKFPVDWRNKGPGVTMACDARMTKIGSILERTKLDELPQLWNILKGEMSFVGPRPENVKFADLIEEKYEAILEFKPGIFGPNQVAYRNECDLYPADEDPELYYREILLPKKIESDLSYFKKANVFSDIIWIFKGLWVSLAGIIHWHQIWERHSKILLFDILLIQASWFLVHLLRFSNWPVGEGFEYYNIGFGVLPPTILMGLFLGGCYRTPIKHFSLNDALRLAMALFFIWMLIFMSILYFQRGMSLLFGPPYWFVLTTLLILSRGYWRINAEKKQGLFASSRSKILIYGGGVSGAALSSWVGNKATGLNMIGFLDDSMKLRGMRINGHRVLGRESDIPTINEVYKVDEIWVTFLPDPTKRFRLQSLCEKLQIKIYWLADIQPFSRVKNGLSRQTVRKRRKRRIKTYVEQPAYYLQISSSKSMGSFEKNKQVLTNIS